MLNLSLTGRTQIKHPVFAKEVIVNLYTYDDVNEFAKRLGIRIWQKTDTIVWSSLNDKASVLDINSYELSEVRKSYYLSNVDAWWSLHWRDMPEFSLKDLKPIKSYILKFPTWRDALKCSELIDVSIGENTKSITFPAKSKDEIKKFGWFDEAEALNPKYPIYIVSKGRWESRQTSRTLEWMHIPYRIVIEPQEYEQYAKVIAPEKILTLPFSDLGQGSIPARNWIWEHSMSEGAEKHWILDDNISDFYRFNNNRRIRFRSGTVFALAEIFTDRYENIAISGFHYRHLRPSTHIYPPFHLNSRVYSNLLIRNDIPYRWRGKYNEDTDLCLRALKDGWCTILFNAFLSGKAGTLSMKGGNMEELYKDDGRLKMAQSLVDQHPDIVSIVWKWNRWQHQINYHVFQKTKLKFKAGVNPPNCVNEHGLILRRVVD